MATITTIITTTITIMPTKAPPRVALASARPCRPMLITWALRRNAVYRRRSPVFTRCCSIPNRRARLVKVKHCAAHSLAVAAGVDNRRRRRRRRRQLLLLRQPRTNITTRVVAHAPVQHVSVVAVNVRYVISSTTNNNNSNNNSSTHQHRRQR